MFNAELNLTVWLCGSIFFSSTFTDGEAGSWIITDNNFISLQSKSSEENTSHSIMCMENYMKPHYHYKGIK